LYVLIRSVALLNFCGAFLKAGVSTVYMGISAVGYSASTFAGNILTPAKASAKANGGADIATSAQIPRHISPTLRQSLVVQKHMNSAAGCSSNLAIPVSSCRPPQTPQQSSAAFKRGSAVGKQRSDLEFLETLLCFARFNGSFAYSQELGALIGIEQQNIATWSKEQWGRPVAQDVLVTALVLSCLARDFSGQRATWELVGSKATEWLRTQEQEWCCANIKSIDTMVAAATLQLP
jgi:hypothetical protein